MYLKTTVGEVSCSHANILHKAIACNSRERYILCVSCIKIVICKKNLVRTEMFKTSLLTVRPLHEEWKVQTN